uniref:uncharacterized protein LOC120337527 n=1 Tax=Styela clava TaxID=7725 RepID=UPI001939710F|nr:uncharacterized protein LOC120337527 [Styela clava]
MELGRRPFPFGSFNPTRQKQQVAQQQNVTRQPRYIQAMSPPMNGGSAESQIANLQQCISAYLDSIQMVCRAGSWLSETFSYLLHESSSGALADDMKSRFSGMLQLSVSTTVQAKNELARILMELSLPTLNNNNQVQAIKDCKAHNAKVLEKCIHCLSIVHNSFFKVQLNLKDINSQAELIPSSESNDTPTQAPTLPCGNDTTIPSSIETPTIDFASEWTSLCDTQSNIKSWFALKERNGSLRKYIGLTDPEIQNLLKSDSVSDLYMKKLNQKIDTALRNYEVGLRGLPSESVIVFGGFYSSPDKARLALKGCCSQMEMEQDIQRLPVSQFLHCELPLMTLTVNKKDFPANANNSSSNINQKKNAIRQLIQSTNQKLSISETDELSSEILGEICPARWRTHVKASLQLLYGNSGLVILDTMTSESKDKQNAIICRKDSFIVVAVTSTWCIKEDPGTMSLLQRNLDPEKTLATINVRYISVFNNKAAAEKRSEPGVFVETFVQTGSQNRRRASQSLRALQTLSGMPLTPMSSCWLTNQPPTENSPVLSTRVLSGSDVEPKRESPRTTKLVKKTSSVKSEGGESNSGSERRRKKKIVVEIKEGDTASEEEKSSDNDDSVKDVINLLSGSSRRATRRRFQIEREAKEAETDEMSENIEKILDSDIPQLPEEEAQPTSTKDENVTNLINDDNQLKTTSTALRNDEGAASNPVLPITDVHSKTDNAINVTHSQSSMSQSQINLSQTLDVMNQPPSPFHQKSRSQTLPVSFNSVQPNIPMHQFPKSSSNTLPQLRGQNMGPPPHMGPPGHMFPNLAPKQAMTLPSNLQATFNMRMPPPDPRQYFQQEFSPHHVPMFTQLQQSSSPRPSTPMYPNLNPNSSISLPRTPSPAPISQQHHPRQMVRPPSNRPPMQHEAPPNMGPPMTRYPPPTGQGDGVQSASPGNVQALLQHFNSLAVNANLKQQKQQIMNENQSYNENVAIQQLLLLSQNQQNQENLGQMQQNSNNNNIPPSMVPGPASEICQRPQWDLTGNRYPVNGSPNHQPHPERIQNPQMMGGNLSGLGNNINDNTNLIRAALQEQMRRREEMTNKEGLMRSESPNEMDQFVNVSSAQGSLGPIGSPVITRRKTNEMSPPLHLATQQQQQGSNTWPCITDLPEQTVQFSGVDPEYEQYVAGIARNAIHRKLTSQQSIDEQDGKTKCNTWDFNKHSDSWQQGGGTDELGNNLFTVFNTPDIVQHLRGRELIEDTQAGNPPDITDGNVDASRTGTWPPWQLWSNGNTNLWNWGNDLLGSSPGNGNNEGHT